MTTETNSVNTETEKMQDLSEAELVAALDSLGLHGEPKTSEKPGEKKKADTAVTAMQPADESANTGGPPAPLVNAAANTTKRTSSEKSDQVGGKSTSRGKGPSKVASDISEKLAGTLKMARAAIEAGEFVSALNLLDDIPEARRNEEVSELIERAKGMLEYEQLWLKAKKLVQKEAYVEAVEVLESIPAAMRSQQMTNMLNVAQNQATVTLAIQNAQATLKEYHFKGAIEILEGVPKERRSDALIELLRETYRISRRLDDLRREGEKRFQKALMCVTMEYLEREEDDSFDKVLDIYKEILEICPIDEEARDRAEKAANYIELVKQREELQEYAKLHFEDKHYRDALECLQKIHPDVQTGPIREQIMELEGIIEQIDELRDQILQDFENSTFETTAESFEKLKELHEGEFERLLREILSGGLDVSLNKVFQKLRESEREDASLVALLDYLVNVINQNDFEEMLGDCDASLLDDYPVSGKGFYLKLVKILSTLTEDIDRFPTRLTLLKRFRQHLKEAEPNLVAWEEMIDSLEQFSQLQAMPWRLKDRWLENDRTNLIELAAYRVADTANSALPQCNDRWERLLSVAGPHLAYNTPVSRILYKQIEKYLKHGAWNGKKICLITRRMATLLGLGGISSIVMIEFLKIYYDILFKAGGFSGVFAAFLLFLLYGTFSILAHRWIED